MAADSAPLQTIESLVGLSRQEIAVLATALALLGFSVVAAVLLLRTRIRSARKEARLAARKPAAAAE